MGVVACLMLTGCGDKEAEVACGDSSQCEAGEACQDGVCIAADCFTAADCPLGSVCDVDDYACVAGCEGDGDCFAGQACDGGECVELDGTCESTPVDCPLGHECTSAGACEIPPDPFCMPCASNNDCEAAGGSDQYGCYELEDSDGTVSPAVCGTPCASDDECPQGFWCGTISYGGGDSVTNCLGPCDLL